MITLSSKALMTISFGLFGLIHSPSFSHMSRPSERNVMVGSSTGSVKLRTMPSNPKQGATSTSAMPKTGLLGSQYDQLSQRLLAIEKILGTIQQRTPAKLGERITAVEVKLDSILAKIGELSAKIDALTTTDGTTEGESTEGETIPKSDPQRLSPRDAWRKLQKGMSYDQVRKLLGEPDRISGGGLTVWYYNGGSVLFLSDRVDSWTEPRF